MLGATNDDLARLLEVASGTIDNWIADIPAFSTAVKEGRELADANVAERLYARALGYSHTAVKIMQSGGEPLEVPSPWPARAAPSHGSATSSNAWAGACSP